MKETNNKGFMFSLASGIVHKRRILLIIFSALFVFSFFSFGWVRLEEDITYYLSDEDEAKHGITIMNEEFKTYATAEIMVEDISAEEAARLSERIAGYDGVCMVQYEPAQDYKDGSALFNITFDGTSEDELCRSAYEMLKAKLSPYAAYFYSASFETMNDILIREMAVVLVIVVIVVTAVLIFTSSTYAEVLVLLVTFVMAATVNMGTNFMLGTISLISNTVAIVLQLALSVDYAIIFCNRYKEEHELLPIEDAVIGALSKSIPAISASSLTTIAGLTAMTFMQFKLGFDMGIVLIKSIVFSLLTVFLFMPAMLVIFGKLMDKTKHRNFVPKVSFMGRFAYASRRIIPPIFVVLAITAYIFYSKVNFAYALDIVKAPHQNEQDITLDRIESRFGKNNVLAVIVPAGDYEKEAALAGELADCSEVRSVLGIASIDAVNGYKLADSVTYKEITEIADVDEQTAKALITFCAADRGEYREVMADLESYSLPIIDMFLSFHELNESGRLDSIAEENGIEIDPDQLSMVDDLYGQLKMAQDQLQGKDHSRLILNIDLPNQGDETFRFLDRVHAIGAQYYAGGIILAGDCVAAKDFNSTFASDNRIVSTLSIVLVMFILLLTFKSIGMPLLLILVIQGSIWMNFGLAAIGGNLIFFMCILIVSAIQMGANIDYAIVISTRYDELRKQGTEHREAIIDTLNLAFPTIITSGTIMVVAGLMIGFRVSNAIISGMGKYVGIGTAISLLLVNCVLPQILIVGDKFASSTSFRLAPGLGEWFTKPRRRTAAAILTVAVALTSFVTAPIAAAKAGTELEDANTQTISLIKKTSELRRIAKELKQSQPEDANTEFAEHFLTDIIGSEQLEEGKLQYDEGSRELSYYKEQLEAGEEEYRVGYETYQKGLEKYKEGEAQVVEGQAQYDAGLAEYEAGKQQLEEGKAQYAEAEEALNTAKELAALFRPFITAVQSYEQRKVVYDEWRDAEQERLSGYGVIGSVIGGAWGILDGIGDAIGSTELPTEWIEESPLFPDIDDPMIQQYFGEINTPDEFFAAIASVDSMIADAEKELAAAKEQIDDGENQLAAAEVELAAGKRELNAGYDQLYAGKAELDEGWAQLEEARRQLDDGKAQIDDGEVQLRDAEKQISEGEQLLSENREKLDSDLTSLDTISDEKEKLSAGIELLLSNADVKARAGAASNDAEICTVAEQYFREQLNLFNNQTKLTRLVSWLLAAAAVLAAGAITLWLLAHMERHALSAALLAVLLSLAGAITWRMGCRSFGQFPFWIAAALCAAAAVTADILVKRRNEAEGLA